jgi:hypothetical protein
MDGVDGGTKRWGILCVMGAAAKALAGLEILAALLIGGCTSAVPGHAWFGMDAGVGTDGTGGTDADADSDIDTDVDGDSDSDTDSDSEPDTTTDTESATESCTDVGSETELDAGDTEVFPVWRFAAFGDSRGTYAEGGGHDEEILDAIATAALADGVDLIIFPGDLVLGSSVPETLEAELLAWRDTMEILYAAGVGVYPVRGNHDDGAFEPWDNVFSGPYAISDAGPDGEVNKTYAVEHENALFLGFDLYVTPHRVNQAWLDERLAATSAEHIFAFGHEPAYAAYHPDCLDDYPAERDAFIHSLIAAGGRTYFAGHDHFYAHAAIQESDAGPEFYQLIIATAGAPAYVFDHDYGGDNGDASVTDVFSDTPNGYLLVEVEGPHATFTWKKMVSPTEFEAVETWGYTAGE